MVKRKAYKNWVKIKGVLKDMDQTFKQEVVEMCLEKAKEELAEIEGNPDDLRWQYEQKYIGMVNGRKVTASKPFEGAEPWTFLRWKLVV